MSRKEVNDHLARNIINNSKCEKTPCQITRTDTQTFESKMPRTAPNSPKTLSRERRSNRIGGAKAITLIREHLPN